MPKKNLKLYFKKILWGFIFTLFAVGIILPSVTLNNNHNTSSLPIQNNFTNTSEENYDKASKVLGDVKEVAASEEVSYYWDNSTIISNYAPFNQMIPTDFLDASNEQKNQLFEYVYENTIHVNGTPESELTTQGVDWSFPNDIPSNTGGELILKFQVLNFNYFDRDTNTYQHYDQKEITISVLGFKTQGATNVVPNSNLDESFLNVLVQDVLYTDRYDELLLSYLEVTNKADGANFVIINDTKVANNKRGSLSFKVGATAWYNDYGILQIANNESEMTKTWDVTLHGFKIIPGATAFSLQEGNIIEVSGFDFANTNPNDIDNETIKSILSDYVVNKPVGFNAITDITIESKIVEVVSGRIRVSVRFLKYYNEDGFLIDNPSIPSSPKEIYLIGFKEIFSSPTQFNSSSVEAYGIDSFYAYQWVNNDLIKTQIKLAIINNLISIPDNFSIDNILDFESTNINNQRGEIVLSFKINYYYDASGRLITPDDENSQPLQISNVIFTGFKHTLPTDFASSVELPASLIGDHVASEITNDELKAIVVSNYQDFIHNVTSTFDPNVNIVNVNIFARHNLTGEINLSLELNDFFESDLNCTYINGTKTTTSHIIVLKGFKIIAPTSISSSITAPSQFATIDPQLMRNQQDAIINYIIFPSINEVFDHLPNDFTIDNIVSINISDFNNSEGKIVVSITINNFYNEEGILMNNDKTFHNLQIDGFKHTPNSTTYKNLNLESDYYSTILPQFIDDQEALNIVKLNIDKIFTNYPITFEIVDVSVKSYDNINGSIVLTFAIKNFYHNGSIQTDVVEQPSRLTISGFKKINATTNVFELDISENANYSLFLPYTVYDNLDQLNNLIFSYITSIINNLPNEFNASKLKINPVSYNNRLGTISVNISLGCYYDDDGKGTLIDVDPNDQDALTFELTIEGFKVVDGTIIDDEFTLEEGLYNNIQPTDVDENLLRDIIWNFRNDFIHFLPDTFTIDDLYFNYSIIMPNNILGTISVSIELYRYYEEGTANLITPDVGQKDPLVKNVTIHGFKSVNGETTIASNIDVTSYYNSSTPPLASEIDNSTLINIIFSTNAIQNMPDNISISNLDIDESQYRCDNLNGTISTFVRLNYYYDAQGILHNNINSWISFPVIFNGFKKQLPTVINPIIQLPEFQNHRASDLTDKQILSVLRENFHLVVKNYPNNFAGENIVNFTATSPSNNKLGQVSGIITINNYFDANGGLIANGTIKQQEVLLVGFQTIGRTYANPSITLSNYEDVLATSLSNAKLKELIFSNLNNIYLNLPEGINDSNLTFQNLDGGNNKLGTILVSLNLKKYYDETGRLVDTNNESESYPSTITIKGFKKVGPTSAESSFAVFDFSNILPSNVELENIREYVWKNRNLLIKNIPDELLEDQLSVSIINADNLNGVLTIRVSLKTYYKEDATLTINDANPFIATIILTGFSRIQPTGIIQSIVLQNVNNILPVSVDNESLKQYLYTNYKNIFYNLVDNELQYSDFRVNIVNSSNLNGTITANIELYKYYDEEGKVIEQGRLRKQVVVFGFKAVQPSNVLTNVSVTSLSDYQTLPNPSEYVSSTASNPSTNPTSLLMDLIGRLKDQIFINFPDIFDLENDVQVYAPVQENVNANSTGSLMVNVRYRNYYSNDDSKISDIWVDKNIIITGFKITEPTTISNLIYVDDEGLNAMIPQFVPEEKLKMYLGEKIHSNTIFHNLPPDFNWESSITVTKKEYDNREGKLDALISIVNYFDENGLLETTKPKTFLVTFVNLTAVKPTLVMDQTVLSQGELITLNIGNKDILPSTFTTMSDEQLSAYYEEIASEINGYIFNATQLPTTNNEQSVSFIDDIKFNGYDDQTGTVLLQASINNFYNAKSEYKESLKIEIKITGYKNNVTFVYNKNNTTFKYVIFIFLIILGLTVVVAIVMFVISYRKKRGI